MLERWKSSSGLEPTGELRAQAERATRATSAIARGRHGNPNPLLERKFDRSSASPRPSADATGIVCVGGSELSTERPRYFSAVNDAPVPERSGTPFLAVIPALNEEQALPRVLVELRAAHPTCIPLVVDDGSTDATARTALEHGARVAIMPRNVGIGSAVQTGFLIAAREGIPFLVQVDADGQHDPAQLDAILAPVRAGEVDVVIEIGRAHV